MVKKAGSDIDGLFRSLGSDSGSYRELARDADAREAQSRWPMLDEIAPAAGPRTEALDASSKRHWRERDPVHGGGSMAPPQPSAEGKRLMGGLDHLLRRGEAPDSDVPEDPVPEVREAESPRSRKPAFAARMPDSPARNVRKGVTERAAAREKPGLFGALGRGSKAGDGLRDTSLSGIFSRLEGDGREPKRLGPGRLRKR